MLASGFSPPLQISQSVVPKLHLSVARLTFLGSTIHSGATHGILSSKTARTEAWTELPYPSSTDKHKKAQINRLLNFI